MKNIDILINENINSFLLNEKFKFKQRMKNALNGFDTGYNYQKNMSQYAHTFNKVTQEIGEQKRKVDEYIDFFYKYQGNNSYFNAFREAAKYFKDILEKVYRHFGNGEDIVIEGIGNRLKGFVRGLGNNYNSQRSDYNNYSEDNKQVKKCLSFLDAALDGVKEANECFIEQYSDKQNLQKLINIMNNFCKLGDYINKYISDLTNITPEEHFKGSDYAYNGYNKVKKSINNFYNNCILDPDE